MSYSILRVEKVKNANVTRALQRHNQRENKTYENKDIDHARTHLNYDLINPERHLTLKTRDGLKSHVEPSKIDYLEKIEERLEEGYQGKRKIRNDAIRHVDGIITSDKDFFDRLPASEQKRFFKDSLEFLKEEYGEKNLLYATVHLDEKTPHMHFGFVPLTEDGRLSAKEILGNKKALSVLQDRFNDYVNEKGYDLERGEKRTDREHLEMQEFKAKTLQEKVNKLENEAEKLEKNIEKLSDIDNRITKLDQFDEKVKEGMFNKVTMSKDDYESFKEVAKSGIATLEKYEDLKESSTQAVQELTQDKQELQKENDYLSDRNQELFNQNRKLNRENDQLKKENKALNRELQRYKNLIKTFGDQVKIRMETLTEKLKVPKLYEEFKRLVFEPSKDYSNAQYSNDRKQEQKELSIENDRDEL